MKLSKIGILCASLFCVLTFYLNVHALPGDLDTTFDGDGKTTASIGVDDRPQDVAIQADGKIILAGYTSLDLSLARLNADGSLDMSFGTGGTVILAGEAGNQYGNSVVILPDGKILVVGADNSHLTVFRFNANGSVDNSFGTNGRVRHVIGEESLGNDAVLQPDGKLIIAGFVEFPDEENRFTVFRLNADGSLDTSFNSIGYTAVLYGRSLATCVALQSDGKIVAGGVYGNAERGVWGRFGSDGILEGGVGALVSSAVNIHDLAIQPDGKYVFAGMYRPGGGGRRWGVTRFNSNKTIDVHFGNAGINWVNWSQLGGSVSEAASLFIQPSGRIVVGGEVFATNHGEFGIARFNAHGFLDEGFGNGGRVMTLLGGGGELYAITQQADGKIVAVGESFNGTDYDYAVARYDASDSNTAQHRTPFDYDGDGRADVSVFRPSTGEWFIFNSGNSTIRIQTFGISGDVPAPADFDGDAKTDLAIRRPSNGRWWYFLSNGNGFGQQYPFVPGGDFARPGDFSGDGQADIINYNSSNGVWTRLNIITSQSSNLTFGLPGDKPLVGDFDGDTKTDPAIYRPSTGEWWYAASSSAGQHLAGRWGISTDIPAPADYDGDLKTDFAVYRPSTGVWYIYNSSNGSSTILNFGLPEDKPVPADYDGDGKADIAVFRPSTGVWYLLRSTAGFTALQFGVSTDIPTPNAFIP